MAKAEREEKREEAYILSLKGFSNSAIARKIDVHRNTVRSLLKEEQKIRRGDEEKRGEDPVRRFVDEQRHVMSEHARYLEAADPKRGEMIADISGLTGEARWIFLEEWRLVASQARVNVPAHLTGIAGCSERIAKAQGVFVEQHEHKGEVIVRQYVGVPVEDV